MSLSFLSEYFNYFIICKTDILLPLFLFLKKKKESHECTFIRSTPALCFSSILSIPAGSGQRTLWEDQWNRWGMTQFTTSLSSTVTHSFLFSTQPSAYFRCPRASGTSKSDQKVWHGVCKQREPFQCVSWRLGKMESQKNASQRSPLEVLPPNHSRVSLVGS